METPPFRRRFADVDAVCRAALGAASRHLSRGERYAVEVLLDLTYAVGFPSLAVTCMDDLSDALEVGGRQNVHTLFRRLGAMNILRWDDASGAPSINPDPHTWLVRPSIPVSVERPSRATAARARLLAHQRISSAQGEFFPEPTAAEWSAEQAQERAANRPPAPVPADPPLPEKRHNSYDADPPGCHKSYDAGAGGCHNSYDADAPRAPRARSDARQSHETVAESNHGHETDARGGLSDLCIAADLERFFVEGGLPVQVIADFRRRWARRIIERPQRVRRCLNEAAAFRAGGGRPNKTWGHYLDYLYKLGLPKGGAASPTRPSPPCEPASTPVKTVQEMTDEERLHYATGLQNLRKHIDAATPEP